MAKRRRRGSKKKKSTTTKGKSLAEVYEEWYDEMEGKHKKTDDFTHECPWCNRPEIIEDHHSHAPFWCLKCDTIRTFRKI